MPGAEEVSADDVESAESERYDEQWRSFVEVLRSLELEGPVLSERFRASA